MERLSTHSSDDVPFLRAPTLANSPIASSSCARRSGASILASSLRPKSGSPARRHPVYDVCITHIALVPAFAYFCHAASRLSLSLPPGGARFCALIGHHRLSLTLVPDTTPTSLSCAPTIVAFHIMSNSTAKHLRPCTVGRLDVNLSAAFSATANLAHSVARVWRSNR